MRITTSVAALLFLLSAGCAAKRVQTADEPKGPPPPTAVKEKPQTATLSAANDETQNLPGFGGATLYFEFGASSLKPESLQTLQSLADVMRKNESVRVNIAGHCDERGTTEYNLALGNARAEVAKKYLVALGVEDRRVTTISFGEESPADSGRSEEAHAANRRDVIAPR